MVGAELSCSVLNPRHREITTTYVVKGPRSLFEFGNGKYDLEIVLFKRNKREMSSVRKLLTFTKVCFVTYADIIV